jgi:hypothetical protein
VIRKNWRPITERAAEVVETYDTAVTLRQVFYVLVSEGLIANTQSDYKNLSRLTAKARRTGAFPPLLDRTRSIDAPPTFDSPADAVASLARWYRRDLLAGQEAVPMIVVEKATLVAQMVAAFGDLRIPVAALRGYASETFERLILAHVEAIEDGGRSVEILYCGDFDPTGEDIPRAFEENTDLWLRRVALTAEQVDEYSLPPAPGKATDSRAAGFAARHGRLVQVELEALPPATLRDLVAAELDPLIDPELVEAEDEREQGERERLAQLAEELRA